ncbi:hypothetical protein [Streptomyces hainanensis]|uniref:Uncharacterized protein n=1 Tax=Streptomyces hainanensis TaxID=402648 RepID=A0A4R4SSS8_9ACTN|nr:hypothetical protein [Streptomyces hainanensis]TDC64883.1 hypothetical protein E1283_31095 [Streptomyces hainanensis]
MEVVLLHDGVLGMTLRDENMSIHGLVHPLTESWARIIPDGTGSRVQVTTAGPRDLWAERVELLAPWFQAGRPGPGSYGLTVDAHGEHTLWRYEPDRLSWNL